MKIKTIGLVSCLIVLCLVSAPGCKDKLFVEPEPEPPLAGVMERIREWIDAGRIVGAEILVIKDREVLLHDAAGYRDTQRGLPVEQNTICRLRSMTKPFVGTSVLMLADRGLIGIDHPVSRYVAAFNNDQCRDITIRQLLTHTGGFWQPGYPGGPDSYASLAQLVDAVAENGPLLEPGTQYKYSDAGSSTLAHLVATVAGQPAETFIHENIIQPLGLVDTFCDIDEAGERRARVSCTYMPGGRNWVMYWDNFSPQVVPYFRGSGGMYGTTTDYARFLMMWMDGGTFGGQRYLSESLVQEALTPSDITAGTHRQYGFHWALNDGASFGHTGSDGTLAWADPERDIIILYFTQSRGTDTRDEIVPLVLDEIDRLQSR